MCISSSRSRQTLDGPVTHPNSWRRTASATSQTKVNVLNIHSPLQTIQQHYEAAVGQWTGCNWQTAFGPKKLNLQGILARQASLLAEATSGEETAAWDDAERWLLQVEADAKTAAKHGENAVMLLASGHRDDAIAEADKAVALESRYRESLFWKPFRDTIAGN